MGFIKAFSGAVGSTLGDQWLDYYSPKSGVSQSAIIFQAVQNQTNAGRGSNTSGSENVITNGSKIVVPEGLGLITIQDGEITGFIAEAGGFEYRTDNVNTKSIFAGDGIIAPLITQSFERFKFGGMPSSQQTAFYINLKEIGNNKFGTQSEIYFDDAFLNTQVGIITRGTYSIKIVDPIVFVKNFVPVTYLLPGAKAFDLQDVDNSAGEQLFGEVISTLASAFSKYVNDSERGNRLSNIISDQSGFTKAMAAAVEENYQWRTDRGIEIVKTAILSTEYDANTKALLKDVQSADALSGARGNAFMQQSVARGIQAAGENPNGGGMGMAFMGMGMNSAGGMMNSVQQPVNNAQNQFINTGIQPQMQQAQPQMQQVQADPYEKLINMKKLLDAGAISQAEFDQVKSQILGL